MPLEFPQQCDSPSEAHGTELKSGEPSGLKHVGGCPIGPIGPIGQPLGLARAACMMSSKISAAAPKNKCARVYVK